MTAASGDAVTRTPRTHPAPPASPGSIAATLDPRRNGLNLLRLVLAVGVIFYHSYRLTGRPIEPAPLEQALSNLWVDGFFALSGFLIVGSWVRRPQALTYLRHRLLRIYPAFVVCLLVVAFVAVPLGAAIGGGTYTLREQGTFVGANLGLFMRTFQVGDILANAPIPDSWNGSLWTLFYEFLCYLAVLVVGLLGVLKRRFGVPVLFAGAWVFALVSDVTSLGEARIPLGLYRIAALPVHDVSRLVLAFAAGALVYWAQGRLRCRWSYVAVSLAIVVGAMWLPDYRLVGAPFLAYALIATGAMIRSRATHLRNDISYGVYIYAFPIQQLLVLAGVGTWGVVPFWLVATALTVVPATLSWFLVEKPAMRLKG